MNLATTFDAEASRSQGDTKTTASTSKFRSLTDYLCAVRRSSQPGAQLDRRLVEMNAALSTYGSESLGEDGGFSVPADFRDSIMVKVMEQSLLGYTTRLISTSNTLSLPTDETEPWKTDGGLTAYWENEAALMQQSKPELGEKLIRLNKIISFIPLTENLINDAPAMASYVALAAPQKINYRIDEAILAGSGIGQPLGILNDEGTIIVAKETGQATGSLLFANIQKLWTAVHPTARANARWFINPELEDQLMGMSFPGTGTSVPAYLPPSGLSSAPHGYLMGKPIVYSEAMPALGSEGDIAFGDLSNYLTATKTGGMRSDVSIHVFFEHDIVAYRIVMRIGGQPLWRAPIVSNHPSTKVRGCFSTLEARD